MNRNNFELDELNPGWIKGWGVIRKSPWDLVGVFLTQDLANIELRARGFEYVVGYGSRQLGANNFIFD
jgi:hypothetical protein